MSIFPSILVGNNDQYEWKYSIGEKNDHYEWKKPQMEKMSIMNGKNNGWVGKFSGRVIASGSDKVGRRALQKLIGTGGRTIQIISAYKVSQKIMPGPTTVYTQQYKMLQDMDHSDPHPRNQFVIDLTKYIQ